VTAFGMQVIQLPPDFEGYPEHDHSDSGQEEVFLAIGGSGWIDVEGERVDLDGDTFVRVGPAVRRKVYSGPQGLRTNLPADLPHARIVIKARLDASGNLRNLQVLEPGPASMTAKIMAALPGWKFHPAMRGEQPVEVNAILGFNIDTNDRY